MSQASTKQVSSAHASSEQVSRLQRTVVLVYGLLSYVLGVSALLALILQSLGVCKLTGGPLTGMSTGAALALNFGLLFIFAAQHSAMARTKFKVWWTQKIPAAAERSTYMLATAAALLPLLWLWQPVEGTLWSTNTPAAVWGLRALSLAGWSYLFVASFAINHFELFGLQQVWCYFQGQKPVEPPFKERWMYRFDRHPIMSGAIVGVWATPNMSMSYFTLAVGLTLYVFVGVYFEERALRRELGEVYEDYARRVGTLVPIPGWILTKKKSSAAAKASSHERVRA